MGYQKIVHATYKTFFTATAVSTMGVAIMNLLNIVFAGMFYGREGSYVVGLALPVVIFTEIITYFFGVGGGIAAAICQGQGDTDEAGQIFTVSLISTIIVGAGVLLLGCFLTPSLLPMLGAQTPAEQSLASGYIRMSFLGIPGILLCNVLNVFVRNDSRPRLAMTGILVSITANLLLLGLFIGIMKLPIYSIALSTAISTALSAGIYLYYFLGNKSTLHLQKKVNWQQLRKIAKPGLAGSMIFFSQTVLTVLINNLLLRLSGTAGIAAYAIVKYAITFIYGVYDSVGNAAQPMLSVYHGERDSDGIRMTAAIAGRFLTVGVLGLFVVLWLSAPTLSALFGLEVTLALRIVAVTCIFSSVVAFMGNLYRATDKAMLALGLTVLDNLVLPAILMLTLSVGLGFGETGIWLALLGSEAITLVVILLVTRGNLLQIKAMTTPTDQVYRTLLLNDEANLIAINEDIEEFCERNDIGPRKLYYIQLCIEEIVVNIIKHGFKDNKEHYIDIRIVAGNDLLLNIRDDAIQFDPTAKPDADVNAPVEERDIGGLGIYLVKKFAKEFSYRRAIGFNNLHIVL